MHIKTDTTMFSLKLATTSDIPLIIELTMKVWPQTYTPILGVEQVTYMLNKFYTNEALLTQMQDGHQFIICYGKNQEAIGFCSIGEIEPDTFKLHKIYVLPQQQGNGVGKFILEEIMLILKDKNVGRLILNVNRFNRQAISFYEKMGFKTLKIEDIDIGNNYYMNDYVLVNELAV